MRNNLWIGSGISGMGGIPMLGTGARGLTYLIREVFRNGGQGFAYDPNDLSTLYQDAAGTIPVTAAGQPVGLMLDKSKGLIRGEERVNEQDLAKWASGGAYGNWPVSTATFDTVTNTSPSVFGSRSRRFAINGGQSFEASALVKCLTANSVVITLVFGTAGGVYIIDRAVASMAKDFSKVSLRTVAPDNAASCEIVIKVQGATGVSAQVKDITVKQLSGNHAYQTVSASRPILQQTPILGNELVVNGDFSNGTTGWTSNNATLNVVGGELEVTSTGGTGTSAAARQTITLSIGKKYRVTFKLRRGSVTGANQLRIGTNLGAEDVFIGQLSADTYREVEFTANTSGATISAGYGEASAGNTSYWDNISVKEVTGYRTDQNYLAFDGADDFLQTNSIDFTTTDKVSLFAGVRKLSNESYSLITETGVKPTGAGSIHLFSQGIHAGRYAFGVVGTTRVLSQTSSAYLAPISSVITAFGDLSKSGAEAVAQRVSGVPQQLETFNNEGTGGGNFEKLPLFIGSRGGVSNPFSGHLYSLIGIGRLTTDSETKALEKSIAKNTGVTLNV